MFRLELIMQLGGSNAPTIIEKRSHMVDMIGTARQPINPLHIKTKELNTLETLVNNHWHSSSISGIEVVQRDTKNWLHRWQVLKAIARWWTWAPLSRHRRMSHWVLSRRRARSGIGGLEGWGC